MIHIQTIINTVFGELDDEGNVIKKVPLQLEVNKLSRDQFLAALEHLLKLKDGADDGV